jgi:hypothetical protein
MSISSQKRTLEEKEGAATNCGSCLQAKMASDYRDFFLLVLAARTRRLSFGARVLDVMFLFMARHAFL